ncbi:MAG: potassium-transporting ATPase subunit KdpC [Methylocella sp.]
MLNIMTSALRISLVTIVLCGLIYPLAVTGLAQWLLPYQANGSLETEPDGTILGSGLIGQDWTGPQWFHGRLSATNYIDPNDPTKTVPRPYNAANSTGSNLGPTSRTLMERLAADRKALEESQPELMNQVLPADMLTSSASGLDPDISPAYAALQLSRVADARGVPVAQISTLLEQHIRGRGLGIFGEPRVNVFLLNRTLQRTYPKRSDRSPRS